MNIVTCKSIIRVFQIFSKKIFAVKCLLIKINDMGFYIMVNFIRGKFFY